MPLSKKTLELVASFQRYVKDNNVSEIEKYSIDDLKRGERELGWRDKDSSFRIAIQEQIKSLEHEANHIKQSHIRAIDYLLGLALVIIGALVSFWLMN